MLCPLVRRKLLEVACFRKRCSEHQAPQWGKRAEINQRADRAEHRLGKRTGWCLPSPPLSFPTPSPSLRSFSPSVFFALSPSRKPVHRLRASRVSKTLLCIICKCLSARGKTASSVLAYHYTGTET